MYTSLDLGLAGSKCKQHTWTLSPHLGSIVLHFQAPSGEDKFAYQLSKKSQGCPSLAQWGHVNTSQTSPCGLADWLGPRTVLGGGMGLMYREPQGVVERMDPQGQAR
jgi:hypothetical protein